MYIVRYTNIYTHTYIYMHMIHAHTHKTCNEFACVTSRPPKEASQPLRNVHLHMCTRVCVDISMMCVHVHISIPLIMD